MSLPSLDLDADTRNLLALRLVPGLGPRLTKALLERFGTPARVLEATAHELREIPHIGERSSQQLVQAFQSTDLEKELELLNRLQCRLIRQGSEHYPKLLEAIYDPPPLLYVLGETPVLSQNLIAMVGTRHCTSYGRRTAERLAEGLARAGWVVVSGMARGIDAHCHRGALNAGGKTIAVLAGGLANLYPPEHKDLADEIMASGALVSEQTLSTRPLAPLFPSRNRIISGLCRGVVVVEAPVKSGALITAREALNQDREVLAVPGPVDSEASSGTLKLLKNGATLVRHADDVLEALGERPTGAGSDAEAAKEHELARVCSAARREALNEDQRRLFDLLAQDSMHVDELIARSGLPVPQVTTNLMMMEMQGVVRRLPGNRYERA